MKSNSECAQLHVTGAANSKCAQLHVTGAANSECTQLHVTGAAQSNSLSVSLGLSSYHRLKDKSGITHKPESQK